MHSRTPLTLLLLAMTATTACDERTRTNRKSEDTAASTHNSGDGDGISSNGDGSGDIDSVEVVLTAAPDPVSFRWDEGTGVLVLDGTLRSEAVATTRTGPWITRTAGSGYHMDELSAPSGGGRRLEGPPIPAAMPMSRSESAAVRMDVEMMADDMNIATGGPLRAGATDDNRDFADYQTYLADSYGQPVMDTVGGITRLDVAGRRTVQVLDATGAPLPGARVSIVDDQDRLVWTGRTYGDGRVPFFPSLDEPTHARQWTVQAEHDGQVASAVWPVDGAGELDVHLDVSPARDGVAVDVCFIIDTTGSMSDEIARVKATLLAVTAKLRGSDAQEVDLHYGAVLYRDIGDAYLTQAHPFTGDIKAFDAALQGIQADGGGDGPESLNQGLAVAMGGMAWREGAARVAFLIADAPPHMDYPEDVPYARSALAAIHSGVRIHTVAASGLDDRGSLVFRQVAQLSRGKFIFIEYGSAAASAADHGVTGSVASNNLDAILYEQIRAEIQGWGREDSAVAAATAPPHR